MKCDEGDDYEAVIEHEEDSDVVEEFALEFQIDQSAETTQSLDSKCNHIHPKYEFKSERDISEVFLVLMDCICIIPTLFISRDITVLGGLFMKKNLRS